MYANAPQMCKAVAEKQLLPVQASLTAAALATHGIVFEGAAFFSFVTKPQLKVKSAAAWTGILPGDRLVGIGEGSKMPHTPAEFEAALRAEMAAVQGEAAKKAAAAARCRAGGAAAAAAPVVIVHFARSVALTPAQQQWVQPTAGSTLALVLDSVPEGVRELADDLVDAAREELREASIPSFTTKVRSHSEGSVTGAFLRTSSLGVGTRWGCVGVRHHSESVTGEVSRSLVCLVWAPRRAVGHGCVAKKQAVWSVPRSRPLTTAAALRPSPPHANNNHTRNPRSDWSGDPALVAEEARAVRPIPDRAQRAGAADG
jgi:hypothetical protein